MKNRILIFCYLFMICIANSATAAYRIKNLQNTPDTTTLTDFVMNKNGTAMSEEKVSRFHQLVSGTERRWGRRHNRADDCKNGNRAFIIALVGLVFWPLGVVAMYYGTRGWKRGQRNHELAVIGFILGTVEALAATILGLILLYLIVAFLGFA